FRCGSVAGCCGLFCVWGRAATGASALSLRDALPISEGGVVSAGGAFDTVTVTGSEAYWSPSASRAVAVRVCVPLPTVVVFQETRSEEHTSELQSRFDLVCRLLLEKKNQQAPSSRVQR